MEIDRRIRSLEDAIAIFNRVLSVSRVLRTDVQPIANPNETSLAEATGTGLKTDGIAPLQSMGCFAQPFPREESRFGGFDAEDDVDRGE